MGAGDARIDCRSGTIQGRFGNIRLPSPKSFVATRLRERLVRRLVQRGTISSGPAAAAMARVPRHVFIPEVSIRTAYEDRVVLTKERGGQVLSTLSQPSAVGRMLEDLKVGPGMRVLEIGAGTGYNAALLAELTGDPSLVTTVEIDGGMVGRARHALKVAGYESVNVIHSDGLSFESDTPFDRIELSVEAPFIAPGWVRSLRDGGLMLLPLQLKGIRYFTPALRKYPDRLQAESDSGCSFMTMRGPADDIETVFRLPGCDQTEFTWESPGEFPGETLRSVFNASPRSHPDINVSVSAIAYVALGHDSTFSMTDRGASETQQLGVYDRASSSVCLLKGNADGSSVRIQSLGGDGAYASVLSLLAEWAHQGNPAPGHRQMLAYPVSQTPGPPPGWQLVSKPHYNLLVGPGGVPAGRDQAESGRPGNFTRT